MLLIIVLFIYVTLFTFYRVDSGGIASRKEESLSSILPVNDFHEKQGSPKAIHEMKVIEDVAARNQGNQAVIQEASQQG